MPSFSEKYGKAFVYITNNFELTAVEVAAIYENRWQIETFFKKIKTKTSRLLTFLEIMPTPLKLKSGVP
ncbi:MAG: transposase [Segetibacter sp.]